jgi:putative DNA primase/helicase
MTLVQAWPDRYVTGWEGGDASSLAGLTENPQLELDEALRLDNETDAHVVPYVLCLAGEPLPTAPRVNKAALESLDELGLSLRFGCALVDVDAPKGIEAAGEAAVAEWYVGQVEELAELDPSPCWRYRTRGGYRLAWELSEPVTDPAAFERIGAALRARIREQTAQAVEPDDLKDWGRCYRLPGVVRDGERQEYPLEELEGMPLDVEQLLEAGRAGRFAGFRSARAPKQRLPDTIPNHTRNTTLYSTAGSLRRAGLAEGEILAALQAVNERCDPPLEADELATIARKAAKYDHPDLAERAQPERRAARNVPDPYSGDRLRLGSEVELADVVLAQLENGESGLVFDRGTLWRYAAPIWSGVRPAEVKVAVADLDGALVGEKKPRYLRVKSATCNGVLQLVEAMRDRQGWFDRRPPGVAFANGVAVVGPGSIELVPHSPDYRLLHVLPVDYDPGAQCPRFDRLLADSFAGCPDAEARIRLLGQYVGACLVGRATRYQRALLLHGEGANGKSTFLGAISALVPEGARAAVPPQLLGEMVYRAELADALINVVTEVPESDIVAGEAYKAFIDGSELMARRLYQAPFKFHPICGHLWACNTLPGVRDFSWGFWRRWLAISWPNVVPEEEQDEDLERRIVGEELAGVARWALDGAAELLARGRYDVPESSAETLERWRRQADQVAAYVDDELDTAGDETTPAGRVYDNYKLWAHRNGHRAISSRKFGERLGRLGIKRASRARSGKRWFVAIRRQKRGNPRHN